jgi:hypothetical protein
MLPNIKITHCFILIFFPAVSWCQTDDPVIGETLESYYRSLEQPLESDARDYVETLEYCRSHPLDLNAAGREDLENLRLFSPILINHFLEYRTALGPLLHACELQAIPGWELPDIRRLLEFASVRTGIESRQTPLLKGLYLGTNECLLRWNRPFPPPYGTMPVEGGPNGLAFRYRHVFDGRIRYGITAENDPGEAFFKGSNRNGFDFYSAHFFIQNPGHLFKTIAIGDYTARLGQGLLLQNGFAPGKTAETVLIARNGRRINPYSSFGEAYFLRGGATTLSLGKHLELTTLFSNKRRDANLPVADTSSAFTDYAFTSVQASGLHRSPGEVSDEKSIREIIGGVNANYINKNGQIGLNGLFIHYDKAWNPSPASYHQFTFRGHQIFGLSADYNWKRHNWYFFGETARSDNGAIASVNGVLVTPDPHVTISALHRYYPAAYQSVYALPFAESSGASNEQGLFLGADIRWIRRWQVNFYADAWRSPWIRFGASGPSRGHEYVARIIWTQSKSFVAYAQWQTKTKEADGSEGLTENTLARFRIHTNYKANRMVELRSRAEWTVFHAGKGPSARGFAAYQEVIYKPLGLPFHGSFRYMVFGTDDYNTRVFTFEDDVSGSVSLPAFSGKGSRYYFNLNWRINKWMRLEARFEQTRQVAVVSGSDAIGNSSVWKIQARMAF